MSEKTFNRFNALCKKIKSDMKLYSGYNYNEWKEMGSLTKLLNDLIKSAEEIEKLEVVMTEEQQKLMMLQEREELRMMQQQQLLEDKQHKVDKKTIRKKSLLGIR